MSKVIKDSPRVDSEDYDVIEKMEEEWPEMTKEFKNCLLYTSPSPRD